MAHGYLGDGYGAHGDIGDDRSEERDHRWRDRNENGWRGDWRDRERSENDWSGRDRNRTMFGGGNDRWPDQDRWSDRDSRDRGDEGRGRERGFGSDDRRGRRGFSAHPDDHYLSWRDRHMSDIDRDYEDYCREREQAFRQDFDAWRRQRHADYQPLRTGMTQTGMSHDPSGQVQVATEGEVDRSGSDPMADATLGTSTEKSSGRSRR